MTNITKDFMTPNVTTPLPRKSNVKTPWEVIFERFKETKDNNDKVLSMSPKNKNLYVEKLLKQWNMVPSAQRLVNNVNDDEKNHTPTIDKGAFGTPSWSSILEGDKPKSKQPPKAPILQPKPPTYRDMLTKPADTSIPKPPTYRDMLTKPAADTSIPKPPTTQPKIPKPPTYRDMLTTPK